MGRSEWIERLGRVHALMFAAGFLLGAMFGGCVGAVTIGALRAAKRDDDSRLHKLEDEVT
jgi:hypothetical protein